MTRVIRRLPRAVRSADARLLAILAAGIALATLAALALRSEDMPGPRPPSAGPPSATSPAANPSDAKAVFSNPRHPALRPLRGSRGCLSGIPGTPQRPCAATVRGQYDTANLAMSPDGRFVYTVSTYSGYRPGPDGKPILLAGGTIASFRRNRHTGALHQLPGAAGCIRDSNAEITLVTRSCRREANGIQGAKAIVMSADGRFAYVAAINNDAISVFRRNRRTGALRGLRGRGSCIQDRAFPNDDCPVAGVGLHGVRWVALSPDGRNLYAASGGSDAIDAFDVDRRTGALTQLPGAGACIADHLARLDTGCTTRALGVNYPRSLVVSPDGRNVYVTSDSADKYFPGDAGDGNAVSAFSRNPDTGALSQLEGDAACIEDAATAPSTTACPVQGKGLFEPFAVVVSPDGRHVYVGSDESLKGGVSAFKRDPDSGALEQLDGDSACIGGRPPCRIAPGLGGSDALTMTPDGRNVYVAAFPGLSVAILARDAESGRLDAVPGGCVKDPVSKADCPVEARGLNGPRAVVLSPDGRFAYIPSQTSGAIVIMAVRSAGRQP